MLNKTKIALAATLILGGASVALADGEFDPSLSNRYAVQNGAIAGQDTFQSARVALNRKGQLRTNRVRLSRDGAMSNQTSQETVYPQSPAGGGY